VCRSGYYQLQATRHSPDLSTQAVKTLVQAFILWRLDYCNSPFYGITKGPMSRLQSVQNAAARLVSGAQRFDHITPVLQPRGLLASGSTSGGFQVGHTLVYLSMSGVAPASWPPTVSWSPTKVIVNCVLPHRGRLLSNGPTATIEKDILQLQVRSCETAFHLI